MPAAIAACRRTRSVFEQRRNTHSPKPERISRLSFLRDRAGAIKMRNPCASYGLRAPWFRGNIARVSRSLNPPDERAMNANHRKLNAKNLTNP